MKCNGCKSEINVVPVKVVWKRPGIKTFILDFNYCPECIKSDIEKGHTVTDLKGDKYVFEPEKFYLSEKTYQT